MKQKLVEKNGDGTVKVKNVVWHFFTKLIPFLSAILIAISFLWGQLKGKITLGAEIEATVKALPKIEERVDTVEIRLNKMSIEIEPVKQMQDDITDLKTGQSKITGMLEVLVKRR